MEVLNLKHTKFRSQTLQNVHKMQLNASHVLYFSTRNTIYKKLQLLTNTKCPRLWLVDFDLHGGHIIPNDLPEGPNLPIHISKMRWGGDRICFYCLILNANKLPSLWRENLLFCVR